MVAMSPERKQQIQQQQDDERTVREALRFFFSPEGYVFREFMLEEIVTVVDASSRDAIREVARAIGVNNLPIPSFIRALTPKLTEQDKQMVQEIRTLVRFLLGDFEGVIKSTPVDLQDSDTRLTRIQRAQQFLNRDTNTRLQKLIPVVREYAPQLREFGSLLVVRLSEKIISRGLNWATDRLLPTPASPIPASVRSR